MTTIISYVFYETKESLYNMEYFLKHGILNQPNLIFIIVINGHKCSIEKKIPAYNNVKIIKRENMGYDFGGHRASIDYIKSHKLEFEYMIFLNSSVIGPFLPTYYPVHEWPKIFTDRIKNQVKLVGTCIMFVNNATRKGPVVESFCFATDKIGLGLIVKKGTIFVNHPDKMAAILKGEIGVTSAIMDAGYNIDCLMYRFKGINWKDKSKWMKTMRSFSRGGNYDKPLGPHNKNGISVHPFEVVFHKWRWAYMPNNLVNFQYVDAYKKFTG